MVEGYAGSSGVDWLRVSWSTLVSGECVESGVVVDKLGARQGEYMYFSSPTDMSMYREVFGTNGALAPVNRSWGDSRASVAVVPTSSYAAALSSMDLLSERHRQKLVTMKPWFLAGNSAPASFKDLSAGFLDGVGVHGGITVWKIKRSVADNPRKHAQQLLAFMSYAKLLRDLDVATKDFEAMDDVRVQQDLLTANVVSKTREGVSTVTQELDKERVRAEAQLWSAAEKNAADVAVVRDRGLAFAKKAGDDTAAAKDAAKAADKLDAVRKKTVEANKETDGIILGKRDDLDYMVRGTASLIGSVKAITIKNDSDMADAKAKIAEYVEQRAALDEQIADLNSKIVGLQKDISYWSSPERLFASQANLQAALLELDRATRALEKANQESQLAIANQTVMENAVAESRNRTATANNDAMTSVSAASKAYSELETARGRLAAAKNFVKKRLEIQAAIDAAKLAEKAAKDKLDAADMTVAASDEGVKKASCDIDPGARVKVDTPTQWQAIVNKDTQLAPVSNPAASCYGAKSTDTCATCDDVVNAFNAKGWAVTKSKWSQCPESRAPAAEGGYSIKDGATNRWLRFGADGKISLNAAGQDKKVVIDKPPGLYKASEGYVSISVPGIGALRHFFSVLSLAPFQANNLDYAWKIIGSNGEYKLYNDYGGGRYVTYDSSSDQLKVEAPGSRTWTWKISPAPAAQLLGTAAAPAPIQWTQLANTKLEFAPYASPAAEGKSDKEKVASCMEMCAKDDKCGGFSLNLLSIGPVKSLCSLGEAGVISRAKNVPSPIVNYSAVKPGVTVPLPVPKAWFKEDGQLYSFNVYKQVDLDRDDSEDKSAARCMEACEKDPKCFIMSHYKPEKTMSTPKQGQCKMGDETASRSFTKKGDGRSFSAVKR
jgi:Endoplasmic reticulum vesicle transporter